MMPLVYSRENHMISGNRLTTAGIPVLELMRKLEDEQIINREDSIALVTGK